MDRKSMKVQGEKVLMTHCNDSSEVLVNGKPQPREPALRANSAVTTEKIRAVSDESMLPSPAPEYCSIPGDNATIKANLMRNYINIDP